MKHMIIGSNTEAMIFNLFNPHYQMVIPINKQKSNFAHNWELRKTWILPHADKGMECLFEALSFPTGELSKTKIPIFPLNGFQKGGYAILDKREIITRKTQGLTPHPKMAHNSKFSVCSDSKKHLEIFSSVNIVDIVTKLLIKTKNPVNIGDKEINKLINSNTVSTIPIGDYCNIRKIKRHKNDACGSVFLLFRNSNYSCDGLYYFVGSSAPELIRKNIIGGFISYELSNKPNITKEAVIEFEAKQGNKLISINATFSSRITRNPIQMLGGVRMIGRMAQCDPDITLGDIVDMSMEKPSSLAYLWSSQAELNSAYVEKPMTNESRQSQTRNYILHMQYKTMKLLDEVQWRIDGAEVELDYDSIVKRLVDIFKYWLSIALVWDLSIIDFIKTDKKRTEYSIEKRRKKK